MPLLLLVLLSALVATAQQDRRVIPPGTATGARRSLAIGNKDYPSQPLTNPVNDATDLAAILRESGFTVTLKTNLRSCCAISSRACWMRLATSVFNSVRERVYTRAQGGGLAALQAEADPAIRVPERSGAGPATCGSGG
jgi:hypothetical protein